MCQGLMASASLPDTNTQDEFLLVCCCPCLVIFVSFGLTRATFFMVCYLAKMTMNQGGLLFICWSDKNLIKSVPSIQTYVNFMHCKSRYIYKKRKSLVWNQFIDSKDLVLDRDVLYSKNKWEIFVTKPCAM